MELVLFGVIGLVIAFLLAIKISRQPFWGLLALVFFLPFERIPTVEVADFTLKINHIVGILLIIFWLLDLAFNHKQIRPNPTIIPVALLVISFFLPFIEADLRLRSIVFVALNLFVILLYFATIQLVDSEQKLQKINRVLVWSSWLVVIFGFYQFFGDFVGLPTGLDPGYIKEIFGFPRVQAFSREPLYLGNYLLIPLSIGFAQYLSSKEKWLLILLLGLAVIFVLTLSRGAYLGAVATFLVFALFYARQVFTVRNLTVVTLTLITTTVIVAGIFTQLGPESKEKFLSHITIQDLGRSESTQGRLNAFNLAIDAWRESPLIGIGLGNYGLYTANYDEDSDKADDIVNNQYLELLAETGGFGLAAYLLLILVITWRFFAAYRRVDDKLRPWLVGLFAAFVGTLVQYNFFSTLAIIHIWVLFGLLVAVEQLVHANAKIKSQNAK